MVTETEPSEYAIKWIFYIRWAHKMFMVLPLQLLNFTMAKIIQKLESQSMSEFDTAKSILYSKLENKMCAEPFAQ